MNHEVAIHNKVALTIEETAAYSSQIRSQGPVYMAFLSS